MTSNQRSDAHRAAVQALFLRHSAELRGFILALLPDWDRVDDVFQETFLTVSDKAGEFKLGTNFLAWACTIARYKIKEVLRERPARVQTLSDEVLDALCASEPEPEPDQERLQALARCLDELPTHTRRAIELRYHQGHRPPEIARRLGWTTPSVYVVLSRARAWLRECVERQLNAKPLGAP